MTSSENVEDLVLEYFERSQEDGEGAVDELCRAHPEHAEAIRGALRHLARVGLVEAPQSEPTTFGSFRLLRRLGRGGMGVVHLAEQQGLGRRVALKLMRPGLHGDAKGRERFRREVEALSKVEHPGICPVYEAGEIGGVPYLAMRHVEGESLERILARWRADTASPPLASGGERVRESAHLVEKVARALHVAHEHGLVHRDVKPANILVDSHGEPVLVDFGLARDDAAGAGSLTTTGEQLGTPAYMAPEQVRGDGSSADRRTDVYALGVTLYECLTLRRPFEAAGRESLYRQILGSEPRDPRRLNRNVDRDLCVILEQALQKDPTRRFATALELAEELARFRRHQPIRSRRPHLALRARRWVQRNPTPSGVLAATFLGLIVSLWFLRDGELARTRLSALALLQKADEVEAEDPEFAIRLVREALRRDAANPTIVARVQELAFELRERTELASVEARPTRVLWSPDGGHFVVLADGAPGLLYRADGTLRTRALPATPQAFLAAAFAPDGGELAVADQAGLLHRFGLGGADLDVHAPIATSLRVATRVQYAPNGERLLAISAVLAELRSRAGTCVPLRSHGKPHWHDGGFLSDGRVVAAGALWDAEGSRLRELPEQDARESAPVTTVAIGASRFITLSACGGLRAYAHDGASLWVRDLDVADPRDYPKHMELDRTERWLLVAFQDGRLAIHRADSGLLEQAWRVQDSRSVLCARFTPDGASVVAGSWSGAIQVFDLRGQELDRLKGHKNGVASLAFSPDGQRLVSASVDGQVRTWTFGPWPGVPMFLGHGWADLDTSADGSRVVFTSETGVLHLCDAGGRVVARQHVESGRLQVGVAADGASALVTDLADRVLLWELREGQRPEKQQAPARPLLGVSPRSLGDGSWLALDWDVSLVRLRKATPVEAALPSFERVAGNRVTAIDTSADGAKVLLGTWLGDVVLVDREGARLWSAPRRAGLVASVELAPDERHALVASDAAWVHLWDLETRTARPFGPHQNGVTQAVFAPDGRRIATAARDGFARVFDVATGRCLLQARADRRGTVRRVAFTSSGQLVTSGADGTVRWWRVDAEGLPSALEALHLPELTTAERRGFAELLR